jgi:hypothetical protein
MAQKNVVAPRLPSAPPEYDPSYQDAFAGFLRLYFNQLDNTGPINVSTQRDGVNIIAALSAPPVPGTALPSLPTQADLANLRVGDVYYDTTASNVLKVKT